MSQMWYSSRRVGGLYLSVAECRFEFVPHDAWQVLRVLAGVAISSRVPKDEHGQRLPWAYAGRQIDVPGRLRLRCEFIECHNDAVF